MMGQKIKTWVMVIAIFVSLLMTVDRSEAVFLYQVQTLEKEAIVKLSDEALLKNYVDTIVEWEATKTFYGRSGFGTPHAFEQFKALVRYRINLLWEIENRKLPVPESLKY